jgi:hypothetical protein
MLRVTRTIGRNSTVLGITGVAFIVFVGCVFAPLSEGRLPEYENRVPGAGTGDGEGNGDCSLTLSRCNPTANRRLVWRSTRPLALFLIC